MPRILESRVVDGVIEKKCNKCDQFKPLIEYHQSAAGQYGVTNKCKECCKTYYQQNRERVLERQREYRQENPEKVAASQWTGHIKRRYNLTPVEYYELSRNGCMICGTHEDLAIDHDHITNEVRGILCRRCNGGLGCFSDDTNRMMSAIDYIENWRARVREEQRVETKS